MKSSVWKYFKIKNFFDIEAGKYHYKDEYSEGSTPYCSASASNNGVARWIDLPPDFEGNQIITGKVGCTAFYEPEPFCATSDCNVLTPKFDMTPEIALFIVTMINFDQNYRWNYGRQCRVDNTKKIQIKLPTKDGTNPDWVYMSNYIKGLHWYGLPHHCKPISTHAKVRKLEPLQTNKWEKFKIKDLFKTKHGVNLELNALKQVNSKEPNSVAFVSRTYGNNGVSAYVEKVPDVEPQKAGTLTVAAGGSVLSTYYQDRDFYSGRDMYLLLEKESMSKFEKLFIKTVIEQNKYRFNYGRQANKTLDDIELKLPIQADGRLDKAFMENYMKNLAYSDRI